MPAMTTLQAAAQNQLRQLVEQIERLEEEKKALAADIRDKYLEAKGVGFDVKAPASQYPLVTGIDGSGTAALASLRLVGDSGVAHEIRTTVHPALVPDAALLRMAGDFAELGVRRWVLQPFRPAGCGDAFLVAAAAGGASIDAGLLDRLRERVPEVTVRG